MRPLASAIMRMLQSARQQDIVEIAGEASRGAFFLRIRLMATYRVLVSRKGGSLGSIL